MGPTAVYTNKRQETIDNEYLLEPISIKTDETDKYRYLTELIGHSEYTYSVYEAKGVNKVKKKEATKITDFSQLAWGKLYKGNKRVIHNRSPHLIKFEWDEPICVDSDIEVAFKFNVPPEWVKIAPKTNLDAFKEE